MRGAPTAAGLGVALALAGLGFGLPSLVVAGVGMAGLAGLAVAWVELALPRELIRLPGPPRVVEGEPFELRVQTVGGRVPPPAGELTDQVLSEPVAIGPRWRRSMITEVSISGRGRHRLRPTRLELRDPLGLHVRAVESADPGELLVLPRIEPVVAAGGGAGGTRASVLAGLESGTAMSQVDRPRDRARGRRAAQAIATAARPRGSTGRRSPAPGSFTSATWSPGPTPRRWSSSTRPVRRAPRRSTPPCAPPPRSAHHLAGARGLRGAAARRSPPDRDRVRPARVAAGPRPPGAGRAGDLAAVADPQPAVRRGVSGQRPGGSDHPAEPAGGLGSDGFWSRRSRAGRARRCSRSPAASGAASTGRAAAWRRGRRERGRGRPRTGPGAAPAPGAARDRGGPHPRGRGGGVARLRARRLRPARGVRRGAMGAAGHRPAAGAAAAGADGGLCRRLRPAPRRDPYRPSLAASGSPRGRSPWSRWRRR